jgi:CMP-N-acetylneuraminic acid synthetase
MNSNSLVHSLKKGDKKKILMHEMPETRSIDIDSEFDFKLVKFLLKKNS